MRTSDDYNGLRKIPMYTESDKLIVTLIGEKRWRHWMHSNYFNCADASNKREISHAVEHSQEYVINIYIYIHTSVAKQILSPSNRENDYTTRTCSTPLARNWVLKLHTPSPKEFSEYQHHIIFAWARYVPCTLQLTKRWNKKWQDEVNPWSNAPWGEAPRLTTNYFIFLRNVLMDHQNKTTQYSTFWPMVKQLHNCYFDAWPMDLNDTAATKLDINMHELLCIFNKTRTMNGTRCVHVTLKLQLTKLNVYTM